MSIQLPTYRPVSAPMRGSAPVGERAVPFAALLFAALPLESSS